MAWDIINAMSNISIATGDQLASALHILGVNFILGGTNTDGSIHQEPSLLIAALATSREARLRLALIPLFLDHPEFAADVQKAAQTLGRDARLVLQCYYMAAVFQQQKYQTRLNVLIGEKPLLPDLFSRELELLMTGDPDTKLLLLAKRHQVLSHAHVNWFGTYQHAVNVWLKGLEIQLVE